MATIILVFVVLTAGMGRAQTDEFRMANDFYAEKDYESAIRLYTSLLDRGWESAALYFNLGNAYFKSGDLGRAILYYLRAKRLDPSDEDIRHNLEFAKQFSQVQMEGVGLNPVQSMLGSVVDPYSLQTMAWASSAVFVLFVFLLIFRYGLGFNGTFLRTLAVAVLVVLIAVAGLTTFKYRSAFLTRTAVIVAESSPVYTGPSERSEVELEGAPGLIVEILSESGDFYNVLFENKRRGWIQKQLVAVV